MGIIIAHYIETYFPNTAETFTKIKGNILDNQNSGKTPLFPKTIWGKNH